MNTEAPPRRTTRLRKLLRRSGQAGALAVGSAVLYVAAAEALSRWTVHADADPLAGQIDLYFVSNGVHIDVWVPTVHATQDWRTFLPAELHGNDGPSVAGYTAFGWGDRGFYTEVPTWDDLTLGVALRAVFWPSATAMHVTPYGGPPYRDASGVHHLRADADAYARLVAFIESGFRRDSEGRPVPIDHPGYGQGDRFFEGTGSYHMFRTCNVWTNRALQVLGQRAGVWTPFERHVRRHLPRSN